jgi:deoxyribonuclease-4
MGRIVRWVAMLPDGRRLGAHLPLGNGMVKAADRAGAIGARAIQIFSDNPTAWRRRTDPPPELAAFRERLALHDVTPVAIHAAYLVNLAGPDPDAFERSIDVLATDLRGAPSFGARFVNVHIGSHRGEGVEAGTRRVADGVARALAAADAGVSAAADAATAPEVAAGPPSMLVLENSAGSGWGLGVDIDELAGIAEALAANGVPEDRVGFCLDTAHAWSAGIDMGSPDAIDTFLDAFHERIGRHRLVMVHFNDSRTERGSRLDRHEHLAAGRIGARGLAHLLRHPGLVDATYILETPGMDVGYDAVNVARAWALAAGEPVDDLPPEAFDVRGSSSARTGPA